MTTKCQNLNCNNGFVRVRKQGFRRFCDVCQKTRRAVQSTEYYYRNQEQRKKDALNRYHRNSKRIAKRFYDIKIEVLSHYGKKGSLQCCWEKCEVIDSDCLTLDHIKNDGCLERKKYSFVLGGVTFYAKLKLTGFPDGYQTLCANHQLKKELLLRRSRID